LLPCCTALLAFLLTVNIIIRWYLIHWCSSASTTRSSMLERTGARTTLRSWARWWEYWSVPATQRTSTKWSVVSRDPLMSSVKWLASLPGTSSVHVNKICFA
jgi:hypothetical protein